MIKKLHILKKKNQKNLLNKNKNKIKIQKEKMKEQIERKMERKKVVLTLENMILNNNNKQNYQMKNFYNNIWQNLIN